jgi:carbamoyltransferase
MIALGIIDSKPSSAAILQDGKILASVAEERLCRMKLASGFPRESIELVIKLAGISKKDIEVVAIAQNISVFEPNPIPWKGWFNDQEKLKTFRFDHLSSSLAPVFGNYPLAWKAHHQLKRFLSRERLARIPEALRNEYNIDAPVKFYDHHYCHATTAYFTSSFQQALVITLDGGGDGRSGSAYLGENGQLKLLGSVDSYNSLGNFYSYITELCGFQAEKHEGKVTGLAALGEPIYADILRQFVRYDPDGKIRYTIPMYHRSALQKLREKLPKDFDIAHLAASVQLILEEIGIEFIKYWLKQTGIRNIAVAGGVFSNVKFNQRVHELENVDKIFVHPAMDDSGLSVGAAFAAIAENKGPRAHELIQRLENVFLGPDYTGEEISSAIQAAGVQAQKVSNIHQEIAKLLAQRHVVARFTGRMEYGPRALGHRSIMYHTQDPSVNDWLNETLDRTGFMPFAPATLEELAPSRYDNLNGAEDPARFMTITFNCSEQMRKESPGVVHADGTARPQIIDSKTAPDFYKILIEYHQITGIPSLINTSFNMHGEPIVCTPEDAIRSYQQGNLEFLAIGDYLIKNQDAINKRMSMTGEARLEIAVE